MENFSGSYRAEDVTFLLKPVLLAPTSVEEKELAIQSGRRHYSEMLSAEKTPDRQYLELFHRALELNKARFAQDLARLVNTLAKRMGEHTVLVSLARAGTPIGVLLDRGLKFLGKKSTHYSVSIIRDRGIDRVALNYILARHRDSELVFVDGWTGKGAISDELRSTIEQFNSEVGTAIDPSLLVVSDLAGVAGLSASSEDYLIPSAILNSIVSGLISRSVLNDQCVGKGDFHACVFYEEKRADDLSQYFVDSVTPYMLRHLVESPGDVCSRSEDERLLLKTISDQFIADSLKRYQVTDRNRIKPGIGESTRALLRRMPDRLLLRHANLVDIAHLVKLANEQKVPIEIEPALPYRAAVVIKTLGE